MIRTPVSEVSSVSRSRIHVTLTASGVDHAPEASRATDVTVNATLDVINNHVSKVTIVKNEKYEEITMDPSFVPLFLFFKIPKFLRRNC